MAGFSQLREAAWLYGDDPFVPLAAVRLFEHVDGSGWEIRLNDPASGPTQKAMHADEQSARAELERLYEAGRVDGQWRMHGPPGE